MELYGECTKRIFVKKRISSMGITNIVLLTILIFPFLYPVAISYALASIGKIKYISGLFIILWFAFSKPRLHTLFRRLAVFCSILIVSTIYNKADYGECIKYLFPILVVVFWCDLAFRMYPHAMLSILSAYLISIAIINIICLFIYPEGIQQVITGTAVQRSIISVNFISNDNSLLLTLLPGMCISMFYYEIRQRNTFLRTLFLYILFTFSMFQVWTGTGVAISVALGMILLLDCKGMLLKRISYRVLIIVILLLFAYICCFQMSFMKSFIEDFLGKSLDYTGRTYLWEASIRKIKDAFFIGYGMQTKAELFQVLSDPVSYSSHNMFFHLAIIGGIFLPISFVSMVAGTFKTRKLWKHFKGTRILALGVFSVLLYFLFETQLGMPWFWILLSLMQYQDRFYMNKCSNNLTVNKKEVVNKVADALGVTVHSYISNNCSDVTNTSD